MSKEPLDVHRGSLTAGAGCLLVNQWILEAAYSQMEAFLCEEPLLHEGKTGSEGMLAICLRKGSSFKESLSLVHTHVWGTSELHVHIFVSLFQVSSVSP